jgi:hypothetical protein
VIQINSKKEQNSSSVRLETFICNLGGKIVFTLRSP